MANMAYARRSSCLFGLSVYLPIDLPYPSHLCLHVMIYVPTALYVNPAAVAVHHSYCLQSLTVPLSSNDKPGGCVRTAALHLRQALA